MKQPNDHYVMYAARNGKRLCFDSIRSRAKDVREFIGDQLLGGWEQARAEGWRVVRVVVEVPRG